MVTGMSGGMDAPLLSAAEAGASVALLDKDEESAGRQPSASSIGAKRWLARDIADPRSVAAASIPRHRTAASGKCRFQDLGNRAVEEWNLLLSVNLWATCSVRRPLARRW